MNRRSAAPGAVPRLQSSLPNWSRPLATGFLLPLALLLTLSVTSSAHGQDSLADLTRLYRETSSELQQLVAKRDSMSPDESEYAYIKDRIVRDRYALDQLRGEISRLGGDVSALESVKTGPKGSIKVDVGGSEDVHEPPPDFAPWNLENWPLDARSMQDRTFMTRLRILQQSETPWSKSQRRELQAMGRQARKDHYLAIVKAMLTEEEGKSWVELSNERGPSFVRDVEKYSGDMAGNEALLREILNEVFDKFMSARPKQLAFGWLDASLHEARIQPDFVAAQRDLRRLLLMTREKWTYGEAMDWDAKAHQAGDKIIECEKELVWLLGYSTPDKWGALKNAEAYKATVLQSEQKRLYDRKIRLEYWKLLKAWYDTIPGNQMGSQNNAYHARDYAADRITVYAGEIAELSAHIRDRENEVESTVIRAGLFRAAELGLLRPHRSDAKDKNTFYRDLLSEEDYSKLEKKNFFRALNRTEVYEQEFLETERERENFEHQGALRMAAIAGH